LSILLVGTKNNTIIWNRRALLFQIILASIYIFIIFLSSKPCSSSSKSSIMTSCDCIGIVKNTSLFSSGCIGKRNVCYKHLPYGGGVDRVISNCED
jgi:hypothetical protein